MPPMVLYPSRKAEARDLVWVTDAARFVGQKLTTVDEWRVLGAQLRAIDDTLQGLWWELRPLRAYEKEMAHRDEVPDPCQYEWVRLVPSPHGGAYGLWSSARQRGWTSVHKNTDHASWDHLERLVLQADRATFEKENWSGARAFRLLQEMSSWLLLQKRVREAETADSWAHWILHPVEHRPRGTPAKIETPIRSDPIVTKTSKTSKKKTSIAAEVEPENIPFFD